MANRSVSARKLSIDEIANYVLINKYTLSSYGQILIEDGDILENMVVNVKYNAQ